MWIYIVIILLIIALIIYVIIESSGFKKVYYNISSDKFHANKMKIAFLADLHNTDFGNDNEKLIQAIDDFSPDIVVFGGDMVTSGWDVSFDYSHTLKFFEKLSSLYPIYYAPGNHEERFERLVDKFPSYHTELMNALSEYGINYLSNNNEILDKFNLNIYGLNLCGDYYKKFKKNILSLESLKDLIGVCDKDCFSILIAHNPMFFDTYSEWGADLVLSGHVHGGIVSLPFIGGVIAPGMKLFPKYDAGLFYEKESLMILTRGIGSHLVPIRIRNKAEIVCITLEGECDEPKC